MIRKLVLVGAMDSDTLEMLQAVLKQCLPVDTIPCQDVSVVIQRIQQAKPVMAVLDVIPAHRSQCLDVIRTLASQPETRVPVVAIVEDNETCKRVLDAGAKECVVKPFELDLLLNRVMEHLPTSRELGYR